MNSDHNVSRRTLLGATGAVILGGPMLGGMKRYAALAMQPADTQPSSRVGQPRQPIEIGTRKQLLFDRRFIAASENVAVTMNPPKKCDPVLKPDKPWEDFRFTSYFTVLQDGDLARMYYSCFAVDQWNNKDDPWINHAFLCYAESKDGIHWEKPNLGIVEYQGSKQNNILLRSVVDGTVFIDPTAPAEKRYKLLHTIGPHAGGLRVSYSSDGIHFTTPDEPVIDWGPDSQQNAFYDPRIEKYVAYLRARKDMGIDVENRSVIRVALDDIEAPWENIDPQIVFASDEKDPADVDFYTNAAVKYPWADNAYFMFPATYHHFDPRYGNDGLLDSSAAASRDGIAWFRPDRTPYVSLGEKGAWDESFIMMGVGLFRTGDKLYQYYNGIDISHGGTRQKSKTNAQGRRRWGWMGLVEQRLDGFYSADAAYTGGWLTTPPITFDGKSLALNINTSSAGSAHVAILGEDDQPLAGYSLEDCDEVMTNDVRHTVTWRRNADVSKLAGRPIRLKFDMRSAKLFAFQFT